jgi:ABC-2 type transport system permease protein
MDLFMRKILAIAYNDIKIEFSSRSELLFFLVLPVIFTTIIGLALGNMGTFQADDPRIPILVVNEDGLPLSDELVRGLQNSTVIRPVERDAEEAAAIFAQADIIALLTIPPGFTDALLAAKTVGLDLQVHRQSANGPAIDQAVSLAARQVSAAVAIAHSSVESAESMQPFENAAGRETYFQTSLEQARASLEQPSTRTETVRGAEREAQPFPVGFKQSSPGQLVTWVLITLVGGAQVFVNERLGGTLRRLMITPSRKATLLTGKILGRLTLGLIQMGLLVGFGAFVLGVDWGNSPGAIIIMLVAFGLAGTALGVMLGAFARTRSQAGGMSVLFSMLLASLGGAWWPLEVTPPLYQTVVKVLPSTWAMIGFTDIVTRGGGVIDILPEAGILLGFAVLFFGVGLKKLRFE